MSHLVFFIRRLALYLTLFSRVLITIADSDWLADWPHQRDYV